MELEPKSSFVDLTMETGMVYQLYLYTKQITDMLFGEELEILAVLGMLILK